MIQMVKAPTRRDQASSQHQELGDNERVSRLPRCEGNGCIQTCIERHNTPHFKCLKNGDCQCLCEMGHGCYGVEGCVCD